MNLFKRKQKITESEAIELAKKDSKYFGMLYEQYFEQIFRFVFKKMGGKEDLAGDLTQQTFMKAMANISKYENRGLPFSSWLYRIAQNECLMYFRNQKKGFFVSVEDTQITELSMEAKLISNQYMSQEEQELLVKILNQLEESQLEIIELRFFQSMSFKQIAEIYNISEASAKMKTYRILKKIQKNWSVK